MGINTLVGGVYFYAQMINKFKEVGKTVPFDRILVNQGNGLSSSIKGVFTAPRAFITSLSREKIGEPSARSILNVSSSRYTTMASL